jgi:hypothetical protein
VARIVSLVPSITELLFDLGLGAEVVGRTAWCIHPRAALAVPKVGGTKDVDLERVRALSPTHVIVNVDENRRETYEALREFVPNVLITHPLAPRDNLELYRRIGETFDRQAEADALCARFETAWAALRAAPDPPDTNVLLLIWQEPWMTVSRDTYVSRTLATIGWQTLPLESAARYPVVEGTAAWLEAVDLVLLSSEPFPFRERHVAAAATLAPGRPVQLIDGEMISWYGTRAIHGLAYLAAQRDAWAAGHRLTGRAVAGRI